MQITEVDNFTKIIKNELITKNYSKTQIELILYGYCFQDIMQKQDCWNFRFNLISDFILKNLSQTLNFALTDLKRKDRTIVLKLNKKKTAFTDFVKAVLFFMQCLEKKQVTKNELAYFFIGWFLKSGFIANLNSKSYHLELKLKAFEFFSVLMNTFKHYELPFKNINRAAYLVFYLKKADEISDFLKFIQAFESMMQFEANRIQKDSNNYLQRWENLDLSNALRTNVANQEQIDLIKKLKKLNRFEELSYQEQTICELRLNNPQLSLNKLVQLINNKFTNEHSISKSKLAYFFKKIKKLV